MSEDKKKTREDLQILASAAEMAALNGRDRDLCREAVQRLAKELGLIEEPPATEPSLVTSTPPPESPA